MFRRASVEELRERRQIGVELEYSGFCNAHLEPVDVEDDDEDDDSEASEYDYYCDGDGPLGDILSDYAKVVLDGSLPEAGREIVTHAGVESVAIDRTKRAISIARRFGAEVSQACGMHIHADARCMLPDARYRVIALAHALQGTLFAAVPESRRSNRYCRAFERDEIIYTLSHHYFPRVRRRRRRLDGKRQYVLRPRTAINAWNYRTTDTRDACCSKYHESRYRWVNTHSLNTLGTIELRLPSSTTYPERAAQWIKLWNGIVSAAEAYPLRELSRILHASTAPELLRSWADDDLGNIVMPDWRAVIDQAWLKVVA